jgi:chorismate mutase
LICAREIPVVGALPKVVRVMVHAYSERSHAEIKHIYTRGAEVLRRDIAQ